MLSFSYFFILNLKQKTGETDLSTELAETFLGQPRTTHKEVTTRLSLTTAGNVHICLSHFENIQNPGNGGAICWESKDELNRLLVEKNSFKYCSCQGRGRGGLLYFVDKGESTISEVCSYECFTDDLSNNENLGLTFYIRVNANSNSINDIYLTSITNPEEEHHHSAMSIYRGNILFDSMNISANRCKYYPAFQGSATNDPMEYSLRLKYSSISNTTASSHTVIYLDIPGTGSIFKKCNIIKNSQVSSTSGIIKNKGELVMEEICFMENTSPYLIYNQDTSSQLQSYVARTSIINCSIDFDFNANYIYGNSNSYQATDKSFVNAISCYASRECAASYDTVADITADITQIIPDIKIERTQKNNYRKIRDLYNIFYFFI